MCDELTSCAVRIREPFEVRVWNISGHGETWKELGLQAAKQDSLWREGEWLENETEPRVRWLETDSPETRAEVRAYLLFHYPDLKSFVRFCLAHAAKVVTTKLTGSVALPKAATAYLRGCTGLKEVALPKAATAYLSGCTGLKEVALPKAATAYLSGCTAKRVDTN
jgi:hypothetical protein